MTWLDEILEANKKYLASGAVAQVPKDPIPGTRCLVTCFDPRVRWEATGAQPLKGERVSLLAGGIPEIRTLAVSIYLTGTTEIAIMLHNNCGMTRIHNEPDRVIANMEKRNSPKKFEQIKALIGDPFKERLAQWIGAYADPYARIKTLVETIKNHPLMPDDLIVHGLVYNIHTGKVEVAVNGYERRPSSRNLRCSIWLL